MAFICVLQYIVWSRPSSAVSVADIHTCWQTARHSEMKAELLSFYKNKLGPGRRKKRGRKKEQEKKMQGVAGEACVWKWKRPSTGGFFTQEVQAPLL